VKRPIQFATMFLFLTVLIFPDDAATLHIINQLYHRTHQMLEQQVHQ
jgi:hypothetical protein